MVTFTPGITVPQGKPEIVVDGGLGPGNWVFRLTVIDDENNESAPFDLTVSVAARLPPPPLPTPTPTPTGGGDIGPIRRVIDPRVIGHILEPTPAPAPATTPVRRPAVLDPRLVIRRPGGPT